MKSSLILPLVASVATLASATNVTSLLDNDHFSVTQVAHGTRFRHGAIERARALRKYGATIPEDLAAAEAAALVKGSVTADPTAHDEEYLCPVSIGGETVHLDFDTGSSDLWVFSSELPAEQSAGHTLYKCDKKKVPGAKWHIKYGDGSGAHGNVVNSPVTVGGVTATSQAVECAQSVSADFTRDKARDGLLGLAFDSINTVRPHRVKTFFNNIQSKLNLPVFTATLKHKAPGSYDFGFIDSSKHTGKITYTPVNTINGFWQFKVTGFAIAAGGNNKRGFSAIADTGTSLILANDAVVNAYYDRVKGAQLNRSAGGIIFPCSSALPDFSVYAGGARHTVPGKYMNYLVAGTLDGKDYCFGGIQSAGSVPFTILGDVFLKSQFAVFDTRGPKIGFAQQK